MAEAFVVKTEVFTERLYAGRGDVRVWLDRITNRFTRETRHYVEMSGAVRSGQLLRGISSSTRRSGRHAVTGTWYSRAPHTFYVLRGTTGPIMTNARWANPSGGTKKVTLTTKKGKVYEVDQRVKGYWMPIPDRGSNVFNPYAGEGHWAAIVSGQNANNFLERAWRGTARDHRAIRGKGVPLFIQNP